MFAKILKDLRLENGFTQQQIADMLEIDRSSYAYYELRRTKPDINALVVLSKIFSVSTDYLLTGQDFSNSTTLQEKQTSYERSSGVHSGDLAKDERQLVLYYRMLNVADKDIMRDTAKQMYDKTCKDLNEE